MSISLLASPFSSSSSSLAGTPLRKIKARSSVKLSKRVVHTSTCERKESNDVHVTDRRNVLIGLGGLYGATATMGNQDVATGSPLSPPDLSKCHPATDDETGKPVSCCPPYSTKKFKEFCPPPYWEPLRIRKPFFRYSPDEKRKFIEAITAMKSLSPDDPWNYMQQANIHCAYCNGAFDQPGYEPPVLLQVHGSWFFHPWHRYYLYFWERILGKLIGDPTFAIPYWNWDTPGGMFMPPMYYRNPDSPLYNDNRDKNHYMTVLDYKYAYGDQNKTTPWEIEETKMKNLYELNNMFSREYLSTPRLFMGQPLKAGHETVPNNAAAGKLEHLHNAIHQWIGPPVKPYYDMGNFYTAARDTMFFGHHANVDRMWDIYSNLRGNRREFRDHDWLNSEFIFYDENREVVKVKVRDCLRREKLRYAYSQEQLPWLDVRKKYRKHRRSGARKRSAGDSLQLEPIAEFGSQPRALKEPIRALVTRPKVSRSKDEKEDASEVLVVDGIEVPHGQPARFDVYVTKPIEGLAGPDNGEFAGSFVKIPHTHGKDKAHVGGGQKTALELGLSVVLEDIEAESSSKLVVTLVPRLGEVTVSGLRIDLFEVEEDDEADEANNDAGEL